MVMRHSLLASVLEIVESNARFQERIAVFEIGPVYLCAEDGELPAEPLKLAIALTGPRALPSWREPASKEFDFFDLKGILEALFEGLKVGIVEDTIGVISIGPVEKGEGSRLVGCFPLAAVREEESHVGIAGKSVVDAYTFGHRSWDRQRDAWPGKRGGADSGAGHYVCLPSENPPKAPLYW